jgi:ATP synthase protein I
MSDEDGSRGGGGDSFQARLAAARQRQGLEQKPPAPQDDHSLANASALRIGLRVGVELVSALIVAVAIGYGLDRLLGTKPILTAVFVLLGGAAGVLNVWRLFAPRTGPGRGGLG